jgi:CheY-like chemotaxis protein
VRCKIHSGRANKKKVSSHIKMTSFILIAEDDPDDQRLTRDAFKEASTDHGDIKFVENGEELLNYLRSSITNSKIHRRPDIILLDLNMPKKDGREALKEIKGDLALKYIPVLIMTTSKANEDILNGPIFFLI